MNIHSIDPKKLSGATPQTTQVVKGYQGQAISEEKGQTKTLVDQFGQAHPFKSLLQVLGGKGSQPKKA